MKSIGASNGSEYTYKAEQGLCMAEKFKPVVKIPNACEVELKGNETLLKVICINLNKMPLIIEN